MYDLFSDFFDGFNIYPVYRQEAVCKKCGRTYSEFQKTGKLGCGECYEAFSQPIDSALKNFHGNLEYKGKIPCGLSEELLKKRKIEDLKANIQKAVADENYEEAAKLHKELKSLL
ncbi:MAG: UvrB/UvrC motif-containing protein [Clostridia bacterium]|nr:UvrB/UvrC motif-containing protein [Clostridia bacterium]